MSSRTTRRRRQTTPAPAAAAAPARQPLLLRIDEAAAELQLGRNLVYELVASGRIPGIRIGRTLRVEAEGLRTWIAANRITPAARR